MSHLDPFERTVSHWLHEHVDWTAVDYLDEVLDQTAKTRQRPWWSAIDRWLPAAFAASPVLRRRTGRLLLVVALLAALAATVLLAGSRSKLPRPFGEANNGVVVYAASDGDIYAFDIDSGESSPLVAGGPADETPDFSHDGSRFVFARQAEEPERWILMVADADGGNRRQLTSPLYPRWNGWSPDDMQVAVTDDAAPIPTLTLYRLDGRPPLTLDTDGLVALSGAFRPDGREIVYQGSAPTSYGIYVVGTSGTSGPRVLVPPVTLANDITVPLLSPDGRRLAYTRWDVDHSVIHLVDVETATDVPIHLDPASDGENTAAWSPDGSQMLFHSHRDGSFQLALASIGGGQVVRLGPMVREGTGGAQVVFSPDGRTVIARYDHDGSHWLLDAGGGPGTRLPLTSPATITWQRVAR